MHGQMSKVRRELEIGTYFENGVRRDVLGRRSTKDETVPLDMKVRKSVFHE
jgi:hypothetical protein